MSKSTYHKPCAVPLPSLVSSDDTRCCSCDCCCEKAEAFNNAKITRPVPTLCPTEPQPTVDYKDMKCGCTCK